MSMSQFDCHKVDYLFLLIGENPLPNYVAAKLLLKPKGILYLVHTGDEKTGTYKQARRLQDVLSKESSNFQSIELISLGEYDSDAFHIQDIIRQYFPNNGQVGLNYTGGTKAMAVHAYRAVFNKYSNNAVFSYLNPRRLEMCIDQENGDYIAIRVTPELLKVKLTTLFELHDLQTKPSSPTTQLPQLPHLATTLAQVFHEQNKLENWLSWYHNVFSHQAKKQKPNGQLGDWKSKTALSGLSVSCVNLLPEVVASFAQENILDNNGNLSLELVQKLDLFSELKYFCKWLDGVWLEHYVLEQIKSIRKKSPIADYGLNFDVPLLGTADGFQFDVAFIIGYQLFAISCSTTFKRELCKTKLFEAYLRVQQMGGSEARVALVCCSSEPDSLMAELGTLLSYPQVAVFGQNSFPTLATEIFQWIQDANS